MLRHTLAMTLEQLRQRVAAGWPGLESTRRALSLSKKARIELDRLLDAVRFDATKEQLASPFGHGKPPRTREVVA